MGTINVNGRYCLFPYVGASTTTTFRDSTYVNNICSVSTPNPLGFSLYITYIPGLTQPNQGLTTIAPGSSYQIISRDAFATTKWSITYAGSDVDRLPAAIDVKPFLFMIGLDKNSIVIPISSYVLGLNDPLVSIGQMRLSPGGTYDAINTFNAEQIKKGQFFGDTHFRPNSAYRLRNRVPFTFFAPLQSEMGDAFALGNNDGGEYGMGYRYSQTRYFNDVNGTPFVLSADQTFGIWDKIVSNGGAQTIVWNGQSFRASSLAALSACGTSKALFVLGSNFYGQLGVGSTPPDSAFTQQYYPTWTRVPGQWKDIDMGTQHMVAINNQGHLYASGSNTSGQLGLGSGFASVNTLALVDNTRNYVQVVATSFTSHARDTNGSVYSCGGNVSGQLGINSTTTPIYTLTREATNSTWTSIKTIKGSQSILIAFKNNELYGCGSGGGFFGGPSGTLRILTREVLNLTDITDFYTTGFGTFIRRQGQDYLFAAGSNTGLGDDNRMATVSGGTTNYFTKTTIPSQMRNIISNYSFKRTSEGSFVTRYNVGYIGADFNVYTKQLDINVFVQKEFKAFDAFSQPINAQGNSTSQESPIFLLSAASHFRPTPTPTNTPTPTITPTPTKTPVPLPPASFGYIVVAGGGGGGYAQFTGLGNMQQGGAGGGAGGVKYSGAFNARTGVTYQISVGAGGAGGISGGRSDAWAQKGTSSSISNSIDGVIVTCEGGGWGGGGEDLNSGLSYLGGPGGSGGGGTRNDPSQSVNLGIAGQGNNGSIGYARSEPIYGTGVHNGGAGGGSSQAGSPGSPNGAGNGGNGTQYIIGSEIIQVGGGGGGGRGSYLFAGTGGFGGGGSGSSGGVGGAGTDGTGGGGGGASGPNADRLPGRLTGGKGGNGVIYVFYPASYAAATVTNAVAEISGNFRIYRFFTGNGTLRFN
jgi:hypothetical protein